jgi:hypothetical protein
VNGPASEAKLGTAALDRSPPIKFDVGQQRVSVGGKRAPRAGRATDGRTSGCEGRSIYCDQDDHDLINIRFCSPTMHFGVGCVYSSRSRGFVFPSSKVH